MKNSTRRNCEPIFLKLHQIINQLMHKRLSKFVCNWLKRYGEQRPNAGIDELYQFFFLLNQFTTQVPPTNFPVLISKSVILILNINRFHQSGSSNYRGSSFNCCLQRMPKREDPSKSQGAGPSPRKKIKNPTYLVKKDKNLVRILKQSVEIVRDAKRNRKRVHGGKSAATRMSKTLSDQHLHDNTVHAHCRTTIPPCAPMAPPLRV